MHLRLKVLIFAVTPMLLSALAVGIVVRYEASVLAGAQVAVVEPIMFSARQAELRHYVALALGAIEHLHGEKDQNTARVNALEVLHRLDFGKDGYFFVYDQAGRNLMHSRQPQLVGQDLWNLRDPNGVPTIQRLIAAARAGGGFVNYLWQRPSTNRMERKLGYVVLEPQWGWMIGTGMYLDDEDEARRLINAAATHATHDTLAIIAGLAALGLFFVGLGGVALNLSDQRDAAIRMRALAREVVLSQEAERSRVARELHDGVCQSLVAAKFLLESAQVNWPAPSAGESCAVAGPLSRGLMRLSDVLGEIRRISYGLRPAVLDDLGLVPAIAQVLNEFSQRTGICTNLEASDSVLPSSLAATALFRVVQEALNNIERHAKAKNVIVAFAYQKSGLEMTIKDDGIGFDVKAVRTAHGGGLGLSSMCERAESLSGQVVIKSGADGTSILVRLPDSVLT